MNTYEDFIGVFDNILEPGCCQKYINFFENLNENGLTSDWSKIVTPHRIEDRSISLSSLLFNLDVNPRGLFSNFIEVFWKNCYAEYVKKYSILSDHDSHTILDLKIQKIDIGQGFHEWHCEDSKKNYSNRQLVFMLYLNDVDVGGETDFLYLKKRFNPKTNRLLLWPAGFTHTHRGNIPISNEKYILTGWIGY